MAVAAAASGPQIQGLVLRKQDTGILRTGFFPRSLQQQVGTVVVIGLQFQKLQRIALGIV